MIAVYCDAGHPRWAVTSFRRTTDGWEQLLPPAPAKGGERSPAADRSRATGGPTWRVRYPGGLTVRWAEWCWPLPSSLQSWPRSVQRDDAHRLEQRNPRVRCPRCGDDLPVRPERLVATLNRLADAGLTELPLRLLRQAVRRGPEG